MKRILFTVVAAAGLLSLMTTNTGCVKVNFDERQIVDTSGNGGGNIPTTLTGRIDASLSLPKGKYTLKGFVYVGSGATLTFAAGSLILASTDEKTALIIEQGGKLVADGTANEPIVFTSSKPVGQRTEADWGGISICGNAPTNRPLSPAPITEGGSNRPYGGTDGGHNSGILRYVRIEFAGIPSENNSELNGLTLYGVGAGTIIENVQTSYCGDDGFEFFGGTVNAKNLISFASGDDDFDFDFGYNGQIQFAVSLRDKYSDDDDANQIECDNDATGTAATPVTRPILSNFTLIGPFDTTGTTTNGARHRFGNRWRRSARFEFRNSIILGSKGNALILESDNTINDFLNGNSVFRNNFVFSYNAYPAGSPTTPFVSGNQTLLTNAAFLTTLTGAPHSNTVLAAREDAQLTDAFKLNAPNFMPKAGSPVLTGANFTTPAMSNFFTQVAYRGAFGTTNWAQGWTNFDPKNTAY